MMRLAVSLCDWPYRSLGDSCLKGSSTPAYKGVWRGHHDGTGADTIWRPRLSPMHVLQGNPPWACLRIRHKLLRPVSAMGFPATGPPCRQSAIPPPWATLARWFRTTLLVYPFGISPTPATKDFLAPLHLHIYLSSSAYLFSVLYTYTHLVLDNHLVRLRAQSKFILPCRLLEEGHE
jgi:hypothetical protein